MTQTYTPVYYSSFQDSIASLCKSILPFSLKKRGLPAAEAEAEAKLSKEHSDYLKWQQESFHRILNLMGLNREDILPESEVSHCKAQLLLTLTTTTTTASSSPILRDKLLFLQELLYAKCITDEEYQTSKRALQKAQENSDGEEWSVIDLSDDAQCLIKKNKPPASSAIKQHIKGAAAVLGFGSSAQKQGRNRAEKSIFDETRRESVLMPESSVLESDKGKKKKNGFLGFINNGGDTRQINKKQQLGSDASASEFFTGDNIKKELTRIQAELSNKNSTLHFSSDEMETISTKLPTDKADLHKFFPKSWCDQHGEVVLDVVKKEFNGHVARHMDTNSTWPTFDDGKVNDNENSNPNLFPHQKHHQSTSPLLHSATKHGNKSNAENKLRNQSFSNPFWNSTSLGF